MQKTFCLFGFFILLFDIDGFSNILPEDSLNKKHFTGKKASKTVLLKQSIVKTALDEFEYWRSMTTLRESDAKAINKLKQYWLAVGRQTKEQQLKDSLWQEQHPWSSVFISWVMVKAGAGNKFKPSPNHAGYIVWVKQNQKPAITKDIFVAYDVCDPNSKWPEPGNLVCKNRDGNNFTLSTLRSSDISHSDIVVEVDSIARTITTIGGNLRNTVSKRIIHLDAEGYIDRTANWQLLDEEKGNPEGSQSEIFAVIKLRTAKIKSHPNQDKTQLLASRH